MYFETVKSVGTIPEGLHLSRIPTTFFEGGFSIVYGFTEKVENRYYNSAALVVMEVIMFIVKPTFFTEKNYSSLLAKLDFKFSLLKVIFW